MFKKIVNIGVSNLYDENLNRKIRISNLIAIITIVTMLGFIPVSIYFDVLGIQILNFLFLGTFLLHFYLHAKKHHNSAFYISCTYGVIYFTCGTIFYGLASNLQFFQLVMCLIAIVLFDKMAVLKTYLALSILSFFILVFYMKDKPGLIVLTDEMKSAQEVISIVNFSIFFFITIVFFIFFKQDNLNFQKAILHQKEIIEEQKKEMVDSINYAKRIQYAFMAHEKLLRRNLPEHFILFKPKDIVSGDFYWATKKNDAFYLAVCDSTGHGVPGAFMCLVNMSFLNEAISERSMSAPNEILNHVRKQLIENLGGGNDGMDAILMKFNNSNNGLKIEYAAANNEPILIRDNKITVLPKDKMPVGKGEKTESFTLHTIDVQKGDTLYLLTDGIADQFGGPKGKKFKFKQLEEILLANHHLSIIEQRNLLEKTFNDWKGELEQVDDILLVGIKI